MTRRNYYGGTTSGSGGGGGGAQTLTGDATGTLSGTNIATTVVAIRGNAVATGTPATGTFLWWGGSTWAPSTLNWQPSTGIVAAAVDTAVGISQTTPASDVATVDIALTPQAPFAGATTNVSGGKVRVNLAAPLTGTLESTFSIYRAGTRVFSAGALPISPGYGAIYFAGTSAVMWGSAANDLLLNGNSVTLQQSNTAFLSHSTNLAYGYPLVSAASGGQGTIAISPAWVNPTAGATANGVTLYVDQATFELKAWSASKLQQTLAPSVSGTANTQKLQNLAFGRVGRVITSGTVVATIPLATSTTNCNIAALALVKIAVAGSLNAVGDSWVADVNIIAKNVAGTLTLLGSTVTLASGNDTSLASTTLAASVSGTNILLTLTPGSTGTLGTADCTIFVPQQLVN